jgi:hypothetical protein
VTKQPLDDPLLDPSICASSEHEKLWTRLVPERGGQAETLQGMLLIAALRLEREMINAGGANWSDRRQEYEAYCDLVLRYLCDGTFDERLSDVVRNAIGSLRRWMNCEIAGADRVADLVGNLRPLAYHWCRLHADPIPWMRDARLPD